VSEELDVQQPLEQPPGNLVFLASAGSTNEAAILRGYLEHHGIYCFVQGEQHRSMMGMVGAFIELRLMVPEDSIDDAKELLEQFHAAQEESEPGAEFRGTYRDQGSGDEDDQYDEDVINKARLANKVRRARMVGFLWPFGGAHLAAGAYIRALLLAALAIAGIVMGASDTLSWFALWPISVGIDLLSVRGPLFEKELRLAREEQKQLPPKPSDPT